MFALISPFTVSNFQAISRCGFFNAGKFSSKTEFLWRCRLVLKAVSFVNLKTAKIGQLSKFFFYPTCVLRLSSSLVFVCLASAF